MEKKILFPQIGGIMHGGDYNPEQWLDRPDILEEDIRMMKKAGMNCQWHLYDIGDTVRSAPGMAG